MSKKVYNVSIFFDLHGVTCPGVWLCPKGKILVKISLFGVSEITKRVDPSFPLRFYERFHFQKTFRSARSVSELHCCLRNSLIRMQLIQHPPATTETVVLGVFCTSVTDIICPCKSHKKTDTSADIDLLFCPCKIFPGIIAPKAEVTTQIVIKDSSAHAIGAKMNPATIASQICKTRMGKGEKIIRQKRVCHTKFNINCKCLIASRYHDKKPNCLIPKNDNMKPVRPPKKHKSKLSAKIMDNDDYQDKPRHKDKRRENFGGSGRMSEVDDQPKYTGKHAKQEARKKIITKESSDDDDDDQSPKKSVASSAKVPKVAESRSKQLICQCCRNKETPSDSQNYTAFGTQTMNEPDKVSSRGNRSSVGKVSKQEATEDESETPGKCAICNCPICKKYEEYFIHRAIDHKRGRRTKSKQKVQLESDSAEVTPNMEYKTSNMTPMKCYCFKDKSDYKTDIHNGSSRSNSQGKSSSRERCYVCKCLLTRPDENKNRVSNDQGKKINDKNRPRADPSNGQSTNGGGCKNDSNGSDLRDDFYTDLGRYYCKLIDSCNKCTRTPTTHRRVGKVLRKPSSKSLYNRENVSWGFQMTGNDSKGVWDVKPMEWNKI